VDAAVLQAARISAITDFEDAVQHEAAVRSGVNTIVTRNVTDYKKATLTVLTPAELLKKLP
jgi:hypothetical protein